MLRCLTHLEIAGLLDSTDGSNSDSTSAAQKHLNSCDACQQKMQQVLMGGSRFETRSQNAVTAKDSESEAPPEIPGYSFERIIGVGGMGAVWKAVQHSPRRTVAVKFIRNNSAAQNGIGRESLDRMRQEADAAARLQHPSVVTLYEFREDPLAGPFLTMEFVSGGTLAERMLAGPTDPTKACELLRRLAEAVGFANSREVIHRDLKPTNILLSDEGTPKISDFGIAHMQDIDASEHAEIVGTPHYMAPEQARGEKADGRADVYSLGVILFELVTGQTPFVGKTVAAVLLSVERTEPPLASRINRGVPSAVETICEKCLQRNPERRYASGYELAADLDRFLSHRPILAKRTSLARRAMLFTRRNRAVSLVAVSALLLLSIAVPYAVVMRNQSATDRETAKEATGKVEIATSEKKFATENAWSAVGLATDETIERMFSKQKRITYKEKEYLERVVEKYDEVAKISGDSPEVKFRRAIGIYKVAGIQKLLGDNQKAEEGYREALAMLDGLLASDPENKTFAASRTGVRAGYARLQVSSGKHIEAELSYKSAIGEQQRLLDQNDIEGHLAIATWWAELATSFEKTGKSDQSLSAYDEALLALSVVRKQNPELQAAIRNEASCRVGKASARRALLLVDDETESLFKSALNDQYKLMKQAPEDIELRLELSKTYQELGELYRSSNRNAEAYEVLNHSAKLHESLSTTYPSDPEFAYSYANIHAKLGQIPKKKDEVAAHLRNAESLLRKLCAEFSGIPEYQIQLARSQVALAEHLADHPPNAKPNDKSILHMGNIQGFSWALEKVKPSLKGLSLPPQHLVFSVHRNASRKCENFCAGYYQADILIHIDIPHQFKKAESNSAQTARANPRLAEARMAEAWVIQQRAKWEFKTIYPFEGMKDYLKAIGLCRALVREFHDRVDFHRQLSDCLVAAGSTNFSIGKADLKLNSERVREGLQIAEELLADSPKDIQCLSLAARANHAMGQMLLDSEPTNADSHFQKAASLRDDIQKKYPQSGPIRQDYADSLLGLAQCKAAIQKFEEARSFAEQARKSYSSLKTNDLMNQRSLSLALRDCDVVMVHAAIGAGDHETATNIVEAILSQKVQEQIDEVLAACVFASAFGLSKASDTLSTEQKAVFQKKYLDRYKEVMDALGKDQFSSPAVFPYYFRELKAVVK